jgi:hypothetical protein
MIKNIAIGIVGVLAVIALWQRDAIRERWETRDAVIEEQPGEDMSEEELDDELDELENELRQLETQE